MSRLGLRCNAQLPLTLERGKKNGNTAYHMVTANLGLGGAFVTLPFPLPEQEDVILRASLPDYGELEVAGRVIRNEKDGVAVKFTEMDSTARTVLWKYIRDTLLRENTCPHCGAIGQYGAISCEACGVSSDFSVYTQTHGIGRQTPSPHLKNIDVAINAFSEKIDGIAREAQSASQDDAVLLAAASQAIYGFFDACREFESAVGYDKELLKQKQTEFRERTNPSFSKSYFMNRARTWPRGYPGDYRILEGIYRNVPLSEGIGYLLDSYFLSTTLAVAVRERLHTLTEILRQEIQKREKPSLLDIGCGSCREILELVPEIQKSGAAITCLDHDPDALTFSLNRLSYTGIQSQLNIRRYNALKMVNHERNLKEFGPQDIIYSTGLFDYLADDVLVRLIRAMYKLLNPNGALIASFKNSERYETFDYHWLVDWDTFYQRTEHESLALLKKAGISADTLRITRERSGVILFYIASKK